MKVQRITLHILSATGIALALAAMGVLTRGALAEETPAATPATSETTTPPAPAHKAPVAEPAAARTCLWPVVQLLSLQ
jgi:hypothetical protein